ncbi:aquaporin AQPcic-like [Microplitis mediator]|uniref:aquaporin AQPcic-like n=1 Tax=Microplitis mediator TaxID=375433 RepID=UPI00255346D7|nr:aquaporin AQPcic-like [Microplitis mediator]
MSNRDSKSRLYKMIYGHGDMWDTFLSGMAELVGTAMLVFLGCGGCIGSLGVVPSHLQITLTFGLAVMIVIQCFGHISHAHVNPAMTVGSVVLGMKSISEATVYIVAQNLGGILGYGLLKLSTPTGLLSSGDPEAASTFCVTMVNPKVSGAQGFMVEMMATMTLMLIACAVWDRRNASNTDSTAIRFGLGVTCLATIFGPYTGCSMNPARSFAPAIWNNSWSGHWIYWFGPISGAAIAASLYRLVFGIKADSQDILTSIPESIHLNSTDPDKFERA